LTFPGLYDLVQNYKFFGFEKPSINLIPSTSIALEFEQMILSRPREEDRCRLHITRSWRPLSHCYATVVDFPLGFHIVDHFSLKRLKILRCVRNRQCDWQDLLREDLFRNHPDYLSNSYELVGKHPLNNR
jgi:hypothetical protein